ncbi:MAG: hypothetical protein JRD94_04785 [Deltaproteobacteria bacterium]|nr:hypothetical protein [Deltaproteobacteria bacterium]
MKTLLSIAFAALVAVTVSATGAHADNATGTCNAIVAAFLRFFEAPGCPEAIATGELEGLPGNASVQPEGAPNAGEAKLIQEVVCNAIVDCNFCGAAALLGVCGVQCL